MYRRDRKRRAIKTEPKPPVVEEEPPEDPVDDESTVEEPIPVPSDVVFLPKRRVLGLDIPNGVRTKIGHGCYLAHEHNNVRNGFFFL